MPMKLNTNLSASVVAASFSALLFMSSCSKQDLSAPQPEELSKNSSLRTPSPELLAGSSSNLALPTGVGDVLFEYFNPTTGIAGENNRPAGWITDFGYGISTVWGLGGTQLGHTYWVGENYKGITLPDPVPGFKKFYTLKTIGGNNWTCIASSTIKNLIVGKKYELTYYVSTYIPSYYNGKAFAYSKGIKCFVMGASQSVSFVNQREKWIKQTIVFTANQSTTEVNFHSSHPENDTSHKVAFTNLFVGPYSVRQVQ